MPGSRKGERRGGAKPRIVRTPKPPKVSAPSWRHNGRPKGAKNKPKVELEIREGVNRVLSRTNLTVAQKEREIEAYFMAVGRRLRMPKEVMLDAMRYFEGQAVEWGEVQHANLIKSAMASSDEERRIFEEAVGVADQRLRENLTMAVDVAYKVAPYVHPRLAALMTNAGQEANPMNAIAMLFKELDEAGRPAGYIDHDPAEVQR
jgi:hypothetical protein